MGPGFRLLLIAIALRGTLAYNCQYTDDEYALFENVRKVLCNTDARLCNVLFCTDQLTNLYNEVINNLISYKENANELSLIKANNEKLMVSQLTVLNERLSTQNKDLEACQLELNTKIGNITNLESQLKSTTDQNKELKIQLQSKTEVVQDCPVPYIMEQIERPEYFMQVSGTSTCDNFTTTTDTIRPFEFTWMGQDRAFCDTQENGPGWMVIQRRTDGSTDFYGNWSEYRQGFGDLAGEYFIGLENLHRFTNMFEPCELLIQMDDFEEETRYAHYNNFSVGDENSSYQLKSLGKYSGDAGDALSYNLRYNFSTYDQDSPDKCAELKAGAWWYSENCGFSNLNGQYQSMANIDFDNDGGGIFWQDEMWHHFDYSLKSVKMMIRSRVN